MQKKSFCLVFLSQILTNLVSSSGSAKYNYTLGGSDWGNDYSLCSTGSAQSPIDLTDSLAQKSEKIAIRGLNYPNIQNVTLSREQANSLPKDLASEF